MRKRLVTTGLVIAAMAIGAQAADLPQGLMLNLDFQRIEQGLIPSKTLYPLYVPQGDLGTETSDRRTFLTFQEGQSLDIPHSSLLDPDGGEWVAIIRVLALTDGIVMSQGDEERGYAIYIKDGAVHVTIRTENSAITLKERTENGITHCLGQWITIDLRISPELAILSLNRTRVALVPLSAPLSGKNHRIRLGEHETLPAPLRHNMTATLTGFTGAISSLKFVRQ